MSLTLKIVSRHRQALGEKSQMTFGQAGGTIGRSLEADWSLPDGHRFLSSRHASIDFRSGCYYIVDMSKNGVFINGAEDPVGRGTPQRLFTGDRIRIGEYEMEVAIANVDDTRETLLDSAHVDPVDLKQRVESPDPTSYDLVDAEAITGVGIEMFLEDDDMETLKPLYDKFNTGSSKRLELVEPAVPAAAAAAKSKPKAAATPIHSAQCSAAPSSSAPTFGGKPAKPKTAAANPASPPPKEAKPVAAPPPNPRAPAAPATKAPPTKPPVTPLATRSPARPAASTGKTSDAGGDRAALDAFFRGAGIEAPELNPRQVEQLMTQLGQVTRELIVGVIDCLHLRALQKAQLKQSNTTIQPLDNNRLKFAANVEEGFQHLFGGDSEQYLSPVESVRNTFDDLKNHQRGLFKAARRALEEYLERLEPEQLELRASGGRSGTLINAANKLRYWDLYKDVYAILANRPADELPQPFLDAMAQAYAEESAKTAPRSRAARKEVG